MKNASITSRFRGVCWNSKTSKWKAQISVYSHLFYLGEFDSEDEAGQMYDLALRHTAGFQQRRRRGNGSDNGEFNFSQGDSIPEATPLIDKMVLRCRDVEETKRVLPQKTTTLAMRMLEAENRLSAADASIEFLKREIERLKLNNRPAAVASGSPFPAFKMTRIVAPDSTPIEAVQVVSAQLSDPPLA